MSDQKLPQKQLSPLWFTSSDSYPSLKGEIHADVCVIGLGGSGLSAMEAALDADLSAVGIDADRISGGAAGRNGGLLLAGTAKFYTQAITQLGRDKVRDIHRITMKEIQRVHHRDPDLVRMNGSVRLASDDTEKEDCRKQLDLLREDGFSAQWYSGVEGEGVLCSADATFQPYVLNQRNALRLKKRGARLFEKTPALELDSGRVKTPSGNVFAKTVVVAVDGGLEQLLPKLAQQVRTVRLQMLATAPVPSLQLNHAIYYRNGLDYWHQRPDNRIVIGGGRDHDSQAEKDKRIDTAAADPSEEVQNYLISLLQDVVGVPADTLITHQWAGHVAYHSADLPVFKEVQQGVFVIGAYNGHGNILGRLLGRETINLSRGKPTEITDLLKT
ncbi:MAG: FAD-binding oxidoreductase [Pseudomonadales bacterium]|nr:FAD-binding oxidoreductase [Pseudomonadales bacterium]